MSISLSNVLKTTTTPADEPTAPAPAAAAPGRLAQAGPPRTVTLTDSAVAQVKKLMTQEGRDASSCYLRLGVKGGGCSGLSYLIDFTDKKDALDIEFEQGGLKVLVDKKSLIYLGGTQLDWLTGLKAGWQFGNPNQKKACSCGESFSV